MIVTKGMTTNGAIGRYDRSSEVGLPATDLCSAWPKARATVACPATRGAARWRSPSWRRRLCRAGPAGSGSSFWSQATLMT